MLTEGIYKSYKSLVAEREQIGGVEVLALASPEPAGSVDAAPALFQVNGERIAPRAGAGEGNLWSQHACVRYANRKELIALAHTLEGQLTATLHGTDTDIEGFG